MTKCFNGHRKERPGCAGCHHAHHVVKAGRVVNGNLVAPVVSGPEECPLCHDARHLVPVTGCPQCDGTFRDRVRVALQASEPARDEVMGLHLMHWFVGWQARLAGWFGLVAGTSVGDWFESSEGSTNWFEFVIWAASIPLVQWAIRKRIAKRERELPTLGPHGEIQYGGEVSSGQ